MNKETRKALEGSIKKWRAIVAGTGVDGGGDNCPLCHLFVRGAIVRDQPICMGCPVMERTGQPLCNCTPYYRFAMTAHRLAIGQIAKTKAARAAAQRMLDFLISLRPKAPTKRKAKP